MRLLVDWLLIGCVVLLLVGWLVGRLVGWLVGWLVGRLVGWLVGQLFIVPVVFCVFVALTVIC